MLPVMRSVALLTLSTLVACGGGSGDKAPAKSSAPASLASSISSPLNSSVQSVDSSISSSAPSAASSISSSISSGSSSSNSSAIILVKLNGAINAFTVEGDGTQLDAELIDIELHMLDSKEQIVASATPIASSYNSDELRFSADLSGAGATSIAVTVSYPGYTSFSRKLDAKETINLDAKLQAVTILAVEPDTMTSISGVTVEGFNIAVSSDNDDSQSDSLLIQIPASLLPEGTESLDVAVRTFDPNDPDDAEFFPGAYADSDGNQLASVAFNFAEINTDAGEPLMAAMQKARQQKLAKAGGSQKMLAEEPVVINRQIPAQSCDLLESLGDSATDQVGFQVPVYTYNPGSGLWDLLGQGTVYNADGQQVVATQNVFDCETENFYLEILVTNEIFLSDWWNLDYPLVFNQPTDYCAQIQVKNPDGQVLRGINGYVMDNDNSFDFASSYFTTDDEGKASIRVAQSAASPDLSAEIIFFSDDQFGYVTHTVTLSSDCTTSLVQPVELVRPQLCDVSGTVLYESGAPVTRNLIYGISTDTSPVYAFDFTNSNESGSYRLNLPCGGHYELFNFAALINQESVFQLTRIDGNLDADELSDSGDSVVMKPVVIVPGQPIMIGTYDESTNSLMLNAYSTFDAFPMTAQIVIKSSDGEITHQTFNDTFTVDTLSNDDELNYYFIGNLTRDIDLPASANGYLFEVTVTDALGKTWADVPVYVAPLEN